MFQTPEPSEDRLAAPRRSEGDRSLGAGDAAVGRTAATGTDEGTGAGAGLGGGTMKDLDGFEESGGSIIEAAVDVVGVLALAAKSAETGMR